MDVIEVATGRAQIARRVLEALPQWFGRPDAREHYIAAAERLDMLAVRDGFEAVGFLTLLRHWRRAAEIHAMGVLPELHGQGLGRALIAAAEARLAAEDRRFLTVKTLSPAHPDPHYARTREFYRAVGFVELEEFPTLWGAGTPCLMLVKVL